MEKKGESTYERVTRIIAEVFGVTLLALLLIFQTYNIFSRYTKISHPWMWVEEFTRYAVIWIVFIIWFLGDRRDAHFVVDVLPNKLQGRSKMFLVSITDLAIAVFAIITIWASVVYIPRTFAYCAQSFPKVPMGAIYMAIPIGMILVLIERIRRIFGKRR